MTQNIQRLMPQEKWNYGGEFLKALLYSFYDQQKRLASDTVEDSRENLMDELDYLRGRKPRPATNIERMFGAPARGGAEEPPIVPFDGGTFNVTPDGMYEVPPGVFDGGTFDVTPDGTRRTGGYSVPPGVFDGGTFDVVATGPDEQYVSERVIPPDPPPEISERDRMWEEFQRMNPDLDYDAVARQALEMDGGGGKSVPGGTLTELPEQDLPEGQRDEDLINWVNDNKLQWAIESKTDPRSRNYDPQGAAILLETLRQQQESEKSAAELEIDKIKANAEMKNAEAYATLAGGGMTGGGRPFGGGKSGDGVQVKSISDIERIRDMIVDNYGTDASGKVIESVITDANTIYNLFLNGRPDEAMKIINKYGQPADSMSPASTAAKGEWSQMADGTKALRLGF
jgi:hypothetical protein